MTARVGVSNRCRGYLVGRAEIDVPWPTSGPLEPVRSKPFSLLEALASSDLARGLAAADDAVAANPMALADTLAEQVALLDRDGTIVAVNKAWKEAARPRTMCGLGEEDNYRRACADRAGKGDPDAMAIGEALDAMGTGALSRFEHIDRTDRSWTGRVYNVRVSLLPAGSSAWAVIARYDVTQLMALRRQKRRLSSLLLHAEAEERRRVARDLHDSTAQELVALQLSLAQLKRHKSAAAAQAFSDIDCALERLQREIRALSYLFHAPAIGDGGLCTALETMALGFCRRAGLDVTLSLDPMPEAESKIGGALYRLAQEALANVHRHAKASEVEIRLLKTARRIHFMIRDNGIGLGRRSGDPAPVGVGLTAMRERIAEIGGCLVIRYGDHGTSIVASLPAAETDSIED